MNKLILNNNESLEFSKIEGLNITIEGKTIEELEPLMIKENLVRLQELREDGVVININNNGGQICLKLYSLLYQL